MTTNVYSRIYTLQNIHYGYSYYNMIGSISTVEIESFFVCISIYSCIHVLTDSKIVKTFNAFDLNQFQIIRWILGRNKNLNLRLPKSSHLNS